MAEFVINGREPDGNPRRFVCTGDNTELYVHHPNFADVDHIFHRFDTKERRLGAFIWRAILGHEEFERIAEYMRDSLEYPMFYKPEPSEGDMQQFMEFEGMNFDDPSDI